MLNSMALNLIFAALFVAGAVTSSAGTLIDVAFTTAPVTSKTGFAATGVSTNDFWNTFVFNSEGLTNLEFVDGTPSGAAMTLVGAGGEYVNGASDPMYASYLFSTRQFDMTVMVTNLSAGAYVVYVYGHGNSNNQNGIYELTVGSLNYAIEATTTNSGWLSSVWQEGVQYVVFTNVDVSAGQTITITAESDDGHIALLSGLQMVSDSLFSSSSPIVVSQSVSQTIPQGATATFSVAAAGATPLAYQWLFNDAVISSATNSSFTVSNAQAVNVGNYSVIITNVYGSATSTIAVLNVKAFISLIDVAFTTGSATSKTGFAATGMTTNDFWNTYGATAEDLPNLKFVNGTASGAGLAVGYSGQWFAVYNNGASDPMYATFFDELYGSVTLTDLFQTISLGSATNQMQFFKAVQP